MRVRRSRLIPFFQRVQEVYNFLLGVADGVIFLLSVFVLLLICAKVTGQRITNLL